VAVTSAVVIDVDGLDRLIGGLVADGWEVVGPTATEEAVVLGPVTSVDDLPRGVGDEQAPGRYRLRARGDDAFFSFAGPATSFKPVLFPSRRLIWRGTRRPDGFDVETPAHEPRRLALLGIRGCDLAAVAVHDRVLRERWGAHPAADAQYDTDRESTLVIAAACTTPAATCFCASMGTGPAPGPGYDLSLTELVDDDGHRFVVSVGSERGAATMRDVPSRETEAADLDAAEAATDRAREQMSRSLDPDSLPRVLDAEVDHPLWDEVAERCLACGNCTAVCPTCFCTAVEDVTDLAGSETERWRVWDSCFTAGFSYVHGGPVRSSTSSRYRQWMSHKLGTWRAQFDTAGCVGCGRCITWCPVGIDITAEARALQDTARARPTQEGAR
jgi:sulfhydrogenase subunit beta (sulfur reductase)